jgi:hypothetical protein
MHPNTFHIDVERTEKKYTHTHDTHTQACGSLRIISESSALRTHRLASGYAVLFSRAKSTQHIESILDRTEQKSIGIA